MQLRWSYIFSVSFAKRLPIFQTVQKLLSAQQCTCNIGQIIKSLCVAVSEWVCHTSQLNDLQVAIFYQSSPNLLQRQSPRRYDYLLSLMNIWNIHVRQSGSGINFYHLWKNSYNVKYLEIGKRHDVEFKAGQIGRLKSAIALFNMNMVYSIRQIHVV